MHPYTDQLLYEAKGGSHIRHYNKLVPKYLNGDHLSWNALKRLLLIWSMNIQYGDGVSVVVRARKSLVHGEVRQFISLKTEWEGARGSMRIPETVLDSLATKSPKIEYKYDRLYRNLYNPEFYYMAYSKIYAKAGNMTKGVDENTVDGMRKKRIQCLIEKIRDESYHPVPVRRTYIPKKNGGQRPLGIPSFDDKLVQEIIRCILESIYEGTFLNSSHGFRPNRSCHTALNQIQKSYTGVRWWVEGDIKGFFDNIDHHILINLLRKRIDDEKFINLIWKFLKAGYMEDWKFHNTYSGTPQGGIISPILSNIYLHELDAYMEQFKKEFDKGEKRRRNTEYRTRCQRTERLRAKYKQIWDDLGDEERKQASKEVKGLAKLAQEVPTVDQFDEGYKRIFYVRYADDFLIGIIGSKDDARKVKEDLTIFLRESLNLELSQEKTLITNSRDKARFLGYDICISRDQATRTSSDGFSRRTYNLKVKLFLPKEKWINKLLELDALVIDKNGKWNSMHRRYLVDCDDLEILSTYNAEIRGFYNYYKLACNVHVLTKFKSYMKYSLLKTYANKYKSTVGKMHEKYRLNKDLAVRYETKSGPKYRVFYNEGFHKQTLVEQDSKVDDVPNTLMYSVRTSLIERLTAKRCEWCGAEDVPVEMHHVRKLKDLTGKKMWEQVMIARKRKTLALCVSCHDSLHQGKLD